MATSPRALFICLVLASRVPVLLPAESTPGSSAGFHLVLGAASGPLLGLDRALRGGEACLDAVLAFPGGMALGIGALLGADLGLGDGFPGKAPPPAWIAAPSLRLGIGPELAFILGVEFSLGPATALVATGAAGSRVSLQPGPWPSRFGVNAVLAEVTAAGRIGQDADRPAWRCLVDAELSWSAYEILAIVAADGGEPPTLAAAFAGAAGFAVGFRARLGLRLELAVNLGPRW